MHNNLLSLVQQQFGLEIHQTALPLVNVRTDNSALERSLSLPWLRQDSIERGQKWVTPDSNERTRSEWIVAQMLIALAVACEVSLFSGCLFEVDTARGWVGQCDYLISRPPVGCRSLPPVALIVEVKRELPRCLPHCLVELAAAQQFNQSQTPLYGVLTTGLQWQFLRLQGKLVTIEQTVYELKPLDRIAMILSAMIQG